MAVIAGGGGNSPRPVVPFHISPSLGPGNVGTLGPGIYVSTVSLKPGQAVPGVTAANVRRFASVAAASKYAHAHKPAPTARKTATKKAATGSTSPHRFATPAAKPVRVGASHPAGGPPVAALPGPGGASGGVGISMEYVVIGIALFVVAVFVLKKRGRR